MKPSEVAASGALVGAGGVGEAVAQHPVAAGQGRADQPLQVILAGGVEDQGLGHRRPAVGLAAHQQVAQRFRPGRAPGLPGQDDLAHEGGEAVCEAADLGRLARALPAFEADEPPARHGSLIASQAREGKGGAPLFSSPRGWEGLRGKL